MKAKSLSLKSQKGGGPFGWPWTESKLSVLGGRERGISHANSHSDGNQIWVGNTGQISSSLASSVFALARQREIMKKVGKA